MDTPPGATPVEVAQLCRKCIGIGAARVQGVDALLQVAAIGRADGAPPTAWPQQPPEHAQARHGERDKQGTEAPLQPTGQGEEALRQGERAFGGSEQQPGEGGQGQGGEQQAQSSGHAAQCNGRQASARRGWRFLA